MSVFADFHTLFVPVQHQSFDVAEIRPMHAGNVCVLDQNATSGTIRVTKSSNSAIGRTFVFYIL